MNYLSHNPHMEPWMQGATVLRSELGQVSGPRYRVMYRLGSGRHLVALHDSAIGNQAIIEFRTTVGRPRTWGIATAQTPHSQAPVPGP